MTHSYERKGGSPNFWLRTKIFHIMRRRRPKCHRKWASCPPKPYREIDHFSYQMCLLSELFIICKVRIKECYLIDLESSIFSHPCVVFWPLDIGPTLWKTSCSAVDMSPWGQTDESPFATFLDDQWSARITRADWGCWCIGTDNTVINGLTSPDWLASRNGNIFHISPFQITRDLRDWSSVWAHLMITVSGCLEWVSVSWTGWGWINQWDWLSIWVQSEWSADLTKGSTDRQLWSDR